ncbi:hypothetical protein, conserved [Eimeria praecox]|uniref:Cilia- and flagella-associated protein 91 n=1 Tax=Eimeria praecox TaxID=51316 RepID=U6G4Y4_9EIME|nr:hypothetical protein, conserved [Eimeria praecox]
MSTDTVLGKMCSEEEGDKYCGDFSAKSIALQSIIREQDVQTDPYSPQYICTPGPQPEELTIAHLCWSRGLPATSREIRAIQEMQLQRRLDQVLPPPTDEFCLAIRISLMERQELLKWAQRERDIRELQALERTAAILQREVAAELLTGTSLQLQIDLAAAPPAYSASESGSVAARRLMKRAVPMEEELDAKAVLLLQQLLRAATRRQLMLRGKEKSLDLVNMLRAAEQLQDVPPRQQQESVDRQTALEAAEVLIASAQGMAIAEMLDELSKEQRRMEEVQRISALAHLAVRERRLREAQESGTRQAEEMLRERENLAFQNAMGINNQTVDSYLQAIIEKAGAGNAQQEALLEVCLHSEHLARVVDDLQEGHEEPEVIVGELKQVCHPFGPDLARRFPKHYPYGAVMKTPILSLQESTY